MKYLLLTLAVYEPSDGLCFNTEGELFAWGKGERGQLGIETVESESYTATPLYKAVSWNQINNANPSFNHSSSSLQTDVLEPPKYYALGKISQVSAGMIHSAALDEESNIVYVWGKNTAPIRSDSTNDKGKVASDARVPFRMTGLPENRKVLQISCGSHHTSVLLDDGSVWAVGLATDTKQPIHTPVCLIVPGVIDLATLTQFAAHMDRTTVVFAGGLQVLQAHLWHDMESQSIAVFTPAWVDNLLESDSTLRIREIHRSWLHTVIVAEKGQ